MTFFLPRFLSRESLQQSLRGLLGAAVVVRVGTLNQIVVSGTGFAYSVYLARTLTPNEFGRYGLAFGACMLVGSVANALLLTQMSICMADRPANQRTKYGANMILGAGLIGLVLGPLAALMQSVVASQASSSSRMTFWIVALLALSWLLREAMVRYGYAVFSEAKVLRVNVVSTLALAGSTVGWTGLNSSPFDSTAALACAAMGHAIAATYGWVAFGFSFQGFSVRDFASHMRQAWRGGRWAVGGAVCAWAQTQAYMYVTAVTLGASMVGLINAARLVVSPVVVFGSAMYQLALPRLAARRAQGPHAVVSAARQITFALVGLALVYGAIAVVWGAHVTERILPSSYAGMAPLIAGWAVVAILQIVRDGGSMSLQALGRFRYLTIAVSTSAVIAFVAIVQLSAQYGIAGAVAGSAIGEGLLAWLVWRRRARGIDT